MNINFFMGYIIIAAENKLRIFLFLFIKVSVELIQPGIFKSLSFITAGAGREISIDKPHVFKIQLDYPSLIIAYFMTGAIFHIVRFYFCKYRYAAIPLLLGTVPEIMVAKFIESRMIHISFYS